MTSVDPEPAEPGAPPPYQPPRSLAGWLEDGLSMAALALMVVLPLAEIAGRRVLGHGIPGSVQYVQNLTLWVAFLGGMVCARARRHLALATTNFLPAGLRRPAELIALAAGAAVAAVLAWSAYELVAAERASAMQLAGGIPIWVAEAIMPVGFAIIALRFCWQAGAWRGRALVATAMLATFALGWVPEAAVESWRWPLAGLLLAATILGAPIFIALGGLALALFFADAVPLAAVPAETYRIVSSPTLPTIPLFTLAGSLLAEGGTPGRLVRLFRALAGWLPGGTAVATVLVCAFFTTFTGASGVTILALGGLLLPVLVKDVYSERFSLGAVTATGSIGLLFPPSLPVILYGIAGAVAIDELFLASLVPGLVLVGLVSAFCVRAGLRGGARWQRPDPGELLAALWAAKWEVLLPVVVFVSLFGGFATTVEAAAITALYAIVIKCLIYRDVSLGHGLPRVLGESVILVGGVLIILGAALGLTSYMIDAEIPARGAEWVQQGIESPYVFLLALNLFLLVVGCLMDIFSAIFVVVPLILPVAAAFGIDPLHLGVIFLVNLELGYLTPPVGMNLFLSSYRFGKPMGQVTRAVIPFLLVQLLGMLLVTYLPVLSVGVARWLKS